MKKYMSFLLCFLLFVSVIGQPTSVDAKEKRTYYTVKKGDTLYGISKKFHTKVDILKKKNKLKNNTIRPGQRLLVQEVTKNEQLCIFYNWASYVNGSGGNITKAVEQYKNCDVLVLGGGLQEKNHGDHAATKQIISLLHAQKPSLKIYGYINIGISTTNTPLDTLQEHVLHWKEIGVNGIFVDEFGYDYGVTRERQLSITNFIHDQNLQVFANAWNMDNVFLPIDETGKAAAVPVKSSDTVLLEDLFVGNSKVDKSALSRIEKTKLMAEKLGVFVAGVATVKKIEECSTANVISLYGPNGENLKRLNSFQCSDMTFGSSKGKLVWNPVF